MATEKKPGQTKQFIKDNIVMAKNMEKVYFYGRMTAAMRVSFYKIISMVSVNMSGKMVEYMKDNGEIIKWREKVYLLG